MKIEDILGSTSNAIPKEIHTKEDFLGFTCPEHGIYYKKIKDILMEDPECPYCNFCQKDKIGEGALFYRIHVKHKSTGLIFQKIGIVENEEDFHKFWDKYKWKDFEITPIELIECTEDQAYDLIKDFQEKNKHLKITIPNELKFNLNKTYMWDEVWQAKSKTIPVLRDIILDKQQGNCSICGKPVKAPTLDHMHVKRIKGTGYIRAVCCSQCNTFIARAENNAARHGISNNELPDVLRRMADHLENQTNIIHPTEVPKRKKVGTREWNRVKKYYFKVFPNRKTLPKKPTYVTDSWLALKQQIDNYIEEQELQKAKRKRKRNEC